MVRVRGQVLAGDARRLAVRAGVSAAATVAAGAGGPFVSVAAAHGTPDPGPPDVAAFVLGWTWSPLPTIGLLVLALLWAWAVRRVNRAHPVNRVPGRRSLAFYAGLAAIAVALLSGIERYDTILFSVHMVQHILLSLVAAPLIALAGPVTLVLRVAGPETRRRRILPVLHSRVVRALSFPLVAWLLFAGVMWATHFSPLFDAALENALVHDLEHALFLGTALLFWWPAVGADPSPWRMSHPVRAMYVFLQMPQSTFLAVAILSAPVPLYRHYETVARAWGPTALADQQAAAGIMWFVGDLLFLAAILLLVAAWMRHEESRTVVEDRRADALRAARREREARLPERLAEDRQAGIGDASSSR
jgi:putative copper resistance protein D